jgi:hypothetical protein
LDCRAYEQLSCSDHFQYNTTHLFRLHPTFQDPDIRIDDAALHSWKHNQLVNAETLLTAEIHESRNPIHHALASRALVRARLRQWDAAITDATEVCVALLSHALSLICIDQVHQHSAVHHWLHCKECSPCRERGKGQGISDLRHRIRTLPFISRYLSPSGQSQYFSNLVPPQLLISIRPSSCFWPESIVMQYHA